MAIVARSMAFGYKIGQQKAKIIVLSQRSGGNSLLLIQLHAEYTVIRHALMREGDFR